MAEAEAAAIKMITGAIGATKGDPTNYLIAVRYIEALKEMVSGQSNKVVYMPYEATAILGSIGGIKDMLDVIRPVRDASVSTPPSSRVDGPATHKDVSSKDKAILLTEKDDAKDGSS